MSLSFEKKNWKTNDSRAQFQHVDTFIDLTTLELNITSLHETTSKHMRRRGVAHVYRYKNKHYMTNWMRIVAFLFFFSFLFCKNSNNKLHCISYNWYTDIETNMQLALWFEKDWCCYKKRLSLSLTFGVHRAQGIWPYIVQWYATQYVHNRTNCFRDSTTTQKTDTCKNNSYRRVSISKISV